MPTPADARLVEIDAQLAALETERKLVLPQTTIACKHCGHEHVVGELVLLAWQAYVRPYGCSGGDYWYTADLGFKCLTCQRESRWSEEGQPPKPSPLRAVQHVVAGRLEIEREGYSSFATLVGPWTAMGREQALQDLTVNGVKHADKSTRKNG